MLTTRARCTEENVLSPVTLSRDSVFRAFVQKPKQTGALFSSSQGLACKLVEMAETAHASSVVELGSGTGVVTEQILKRVSSTCRVVSLEIDVMLAHLTQSRCPAAEVFVSDAARLRDMLDELSIEQCEAVVSSLPWANISADSQQSILNAIDESLATGGCFTTFTYIHSLWLPNARRFYKALESRYQNVETSEIVWANMPPALVYKVIRRR